MVQSRLPLLFAIFGLIAEAVALPPFLYNTCMDKQGNYTSDSIYKANLNHLLSSLFSNSTEIDYGYYHSFYGQKPDAVYASGLCRGDVMPDVCHSCLSNAEDLLTQLCPNQKEAAGWYDDCMLRYSNRNTSGIVEGSPGFYLWSLEDAAADVDQFNQDLRILLNNLTERAAAGGSLLKFAVGNTTAANDQKLYALVQCTPDLSAQGCSDCLLQAVGNLSNCCNGKTSGGIFRPSCNFRFDDHLFYTSNTTTTTGKKSNKSRTVVTIVVPVLVPLLVVLVALMICMTYIKYSRARKLREKPDSVDFQVGEVVEEIRSAESLQFDFETIRVATENFSDANKLGQGGFGVVYKGKLSDGQAIGVKRLSKNSGQGDLEFKNEVLLVAKLQHRNLVRLLGFCLERNERILIYEFMPNSSLDHFIFDPIKRAHLHWEKRHKVVIGIARGLLYLHEDSRHRIIHRDLKASNILLDSEMSPKISDFGIARLFSLDESEGDTSKIVGTYGYMAPEYAMHGQFSVKSDVFSFGVLVLEIVNGQKNRCFLSGENTVNLLSYAWKSWMDGTALNVADPTLKGGPTKEIMRCIHVGLLCVQENVAKRPTMADVIVMLNGSTTTLPVPTQPAFCVYSENGVEYTSQLEYII